MCLFPNLYQNYLVINKDETKEMIDSNPGLKSRIRHTIEFPNYTREELEQIGHLTPLVSE